MGNRFKDIVTKTIDALVFNGVNENLESPTLTSGDFTTNTSWSVLIQAESDLSMTGNFITIGDTNANVIIQTNTSGDVVVLITANSGSEFLIVVFNGVLTANSFHSILVSYDGSLDATGVECYVDGVQKTKTPVLDTLATNESFVGNITIGSGLGINYLDGIIAKVIGWDSEITGATALSYSQNCYEGSYGSPVFNLPSSNYSDYDNLSFNGVDEYLESNTLSSGDLATNTAQSWMVEFKYNSALSGNTGILCQVGGSEKIYISKNAGDSALFVIRDSSGNQISVSANGLQVDRLYRVIFTYNGSKLGTGLKAYLNGIDSGTGAGSIVNNNTFTDTLGVGVWTSFSTLFFDGHIYKLKIWGNELDTSTAEFYSQRDYNGDFGSPIVDYDMNIFDGTNLVNSGTGGGEYDLTDTNMDLSNKGTDYIMINDGSGEEEYDTFANNMDLTNKQTESISC